MKKRMILLFAIIICSMSLVFSGEAVCEEEEMRGYFMTGMSTVDLDDLNSRFQNKGYSEISEDLYGFGGGFFHKVTPKFMIGVEGQFQIGEQHSSTIGGKRYSSSIIGGHGLVNTAYLVYESDHLDLFPILGMGIGGVNVKMGQSSFEDILDNPHRPASLTSLSFLLNVGIETDFKVRMPGDNKDDDFLFIGLRGGYMFSPVKGGWFADEMNLAGDPEGGMSGPYICVTFGGGGKNFKKMFDNNGDSKHHN